MSIHDDFDRFNKKKSIREMNINGYTVRILRSYEELETVKDVWVLLQVTPNASYDAFIATMKSTQAVLYPFVMIFTKDDAISMLVIASVQLIQQEFYVGYVKLKAPTVRQMTIAYGGFLGDVHKHEATVVQALFLQCQTERIDALYVGYCKKDSPLFQAFYTEIPFFCRDFAARTNLHWSVQLPNHFEEFLSKSPHRAKKIRYLQRRFENQFSGEIAFKEFGAIHHMQEMIVQVNAIAQRSYQQKIKVGFQNTEFFRKYYALLSTSGMVSSFILFVKNEPIAFWLGKKINTTFFLDYTGYDPQYATYDVGQLTFLHMVKELMKRGIKTIDFGYGDAQYKRRYGDCSWNEAALNIYLNTKRGLMTKVLYYLYSTISFISRTCAVHLKVLDSVRQVWRRRSLSAVL